MSQNSGKDDSAPQLGKITCGGCFKVLKVDLRLAGKKGVCPKCKAVFIVPAVTPAPDINPRTPESSATKPTFEEDFDISLEKDVTFSGGTLHKPKEDFLAGDDFIEPTIIEPGGEGSPGVPEITPFSHDPFSPLGPSSAPPPISPLGAPHPLSGSNPYAVPSYQTHPSPLKPVGGVGNYALASGYMSPGMKTTAQVMGGILMAITGLQFLGLLLLILFAIIGMQVIMSDPSLGPARDSMRLNQGAFGTAFMIATLIVVVLLIQCVLIFNAGLSLLRVRSRAMALTGTIFALIPCNCMSFWFSGVLAVIGIGDVIRFIVAVIALVMLLSPGAAQEFASNDG